MTSFEDTKGQFGYRTISAEAAKAMMDKESDFVLLDVRSEEEYRMAHIKGAMLLPVDQLEEQVEELLLDPYQKLFVYCRSGIRSVYACQILASKGYRYVYEFGGITEWTYGIEYGF